MMQIKVTAPAQIYTTIQLPSSKSISNRALIINALGNRTFQLENLSDCDDTQVMIHALNDGTNTIDIMAAGTAMRFLTAYLSVTPGTRIITGTQRMQQRPIQVLVNALRELGAEIEYIINDGYPPSAYHRTQTAERYHQPAGQYQFSIYLSLIDDCSYTK